MNHVPAASDSPQVIAPPPFVYAVGLATGIVINFAKPVPFVPEHLAVAAGIALMLIAVFLMALALRALVRAGTNVDVRKPSLVIATTGPYRFTRNPIYLAMALFMVGAGVFFNALWVLVALVPVMFVIRFGVIAREETYLTQKFGEEYLRYKARVRRWL